MGTVLAVAFYACVGLIFLAASKEKRVLVVLLGLIAGVIAGAGQSTVCYTKGKGEKGSGDWVCPGGSK